MSRTYERILVAALAVAWLGLVDAAWAQWDVEYGEERPHHLSILAGATYLDTERDSAFTLGVDYEYRVNTLFGVGAVAEYAFKGLDATTLLAVADIHIWRGFVLQVGPGVEFGEETLAVGRVGALYELEYERFTVSPQVHYDGSKESTVIFALAVGCYL